eukprot:364781-Chlamydomonas_euryale.AAC.14
MPEAEGQRTFMCMHVLGQRPVEAEAGVIGRDRRPRQACLCTDHPASVSHEGKRSGPLMHTG